MSFLGIRVISAIPDVYNFSHHRHGSTMPLRWKTARAYCVPSLTRPCQHIAVVVIEAVQKVQCRARAGLAVFVGPSSLLGGSVGLSLEQSRRVAML